MPVSAEAERILSHAVEPLPLDRKDMHPLPNVCGLRSADSLFPGARFANAALAGFLLRAGCWEASHAVAQDIETAEGSYWHGIVHRIEPDSTNAGYWFRRVGRHPIFPELRERASKILSEHSWLKSTWDPFAFIEWCEEARGAGAEADASATAIQTIEWQLLFDWCVARP